MNIRLEGVGEIQDYGINFRRDGSGIKLELNIPYHILRRVGETLERRIRERTAEGIDAEGEPFEPYSKDYAKKRLKEGKPTNIVTLQYTGEMLRNLRSSVNTTKQEVVLHFPDPQQALKAAAHNEESARVLRRFFALNEEDMVTARDIIAEWWSAHMLEMVQKKFAAVAVKIRGLR